MPTASRFRHRHACEGLEGRRLLTATAVAALPAAFVENRGQWAEELRFTARNGDGTAAFTDGGIRFQARGAGGEQPAAVGLTFEGASDRVAVRGEARQPGRYNFFLGNDPARWRSNVRAYGSILYDGLYDGVDVRVRRAAGGAFEYDLLLDPDADLGQVAICAEGASGLRLADDGSLVVHTATGDLVQSAPVTWEVLPGGRTRPVQAAFRVIDATRYGFVAPGRDASRPLVVDPGLDWATFLGGGDNDRVDDVAVARDGTGDLVVVGSTESVDFPGTGGGPRPTANEFGAVNAVPFVARLSGDGSRLRYATYFGSPGGEGRDFAPTVALDPAGAPVVAGDTGSADFPTTPGAYQRTLKGASDAFVTKFNPAGNRIVFSTLFGGAGAHPDGTGAGSGGERAIAVAVTAADGGGVVIAGSTDSPDLPTTAGAFDRTLNLPAGVSPGGAEFDAYVARLSADGRRLTYATFLGGTGSDEAYDVVADARGFVTVVGLTSPETAFDEDGDEVVVGRPFPTTPGAVARRHPSDGEDGFVARLRPAGGGAGDLRYGTILGGGSGADATTAVAFDPADPRVVVVAGRSDSWDFPTTAGVLERTPSQADEEFVTVSRFSFDRPDGGGAMTWSTFNGRTFGDPDVTVDGERNVVVVGRPDGPERPTTERAFDRTPDGGPAFVSRISRDGRSLLYATFLDGAATFARPRVERAGGPASVVVVGRTLDGEFPATAGSFDPAINTPGGNPGFFDGYVAKLTLRPTDTGDVSAAAPMPLSPAHRAVLPADTSPGGTQFVTFDWTDVADRSGLRAYELEVSPNAEFTDEFAAGDEVERVRTTESRATLTTLSDGRVYFWRVRTLDNANNRGPWSAVRWLAVGSSKGPPVLAAATVRPTGVVGGRVAEGKVLLQGFAPPGGVLIKLSSSDPAIARVPATVRVAAGAHIATFPIRTAAVRAARPVRIFVELGDAEVVPVLWVDPAPPAPTAPRATP